MTAYLVANPPARSQYRVPRRGDIKHIIVHVTTQKPDLDGADGNAEQAARVIANRTDAAGSYHKLTDRDSVVQVVPDEWEAFGARDGWNWTALHVSMATDTNWSDLTAVQRAQFGLKCAEVCADWVRAYGIPVELGDVNGRTPGFYAHAHVDPGRRTDPGWSANDWLGFLATVRELVMPEPVTTIRARGDMWKGGRWPAWRVHADGRVVPINGAPLVKQLTEFGVAKLDHPVTSAWRDDDLNVIVLESEADGGTFALPIKV